MRRLVLAMVLILGSTALHAQQAPLPTITPPANAPKVTPLVADAQVTGIPDKVFVLLTADWAPGVTTGRRTHPGDEYGSVAEGTLVTRQDGGEWKTVAAGQSYYVPANIVHETKNIGDKPAKSYNAFVVEKGKPRATPAE
jgi:quercetin dioxygenase-like cupin family protein